MKRLIRFARRHPLLTCSLAANLALGAAFAVDHFRQAARFNEAMGISWRADGSYVRMLVDWNTAVETGDAARLEQLGSYAHSLAETREANRIRMLGQGVDWVQ